MLDLERGGHLVLSSEPHHVDQRDDALRVG
jgi:hypothetical protein